MFEVTGRRNSNWTCWTETVVLPESCSISSRNSYVAASSLLMDMVPLASMQSALDMIDLVFSYLFTITSSLVDGDGSVHRSLLSGSREKAAARRVGTNIKRSRCSSHTHVMELIVDQRQIGWAWGKDLGEPLSAKPTALGRAHASIERLLEGYAWTLLTFLSCFGG